VPTLLFVLLNKDAQLLPPDAFLNKKMHKKASSAFVHGPGWGAYSVSTDPLAGLRDPTSNRRGSGAYT